jgi:hypothetical protein
MREARSGALRGLEGERIPQGCTLYIIPQLGGVFNGFLMFS